MSPNSLKFIERPTAWLPTVRKITMPMTATTPRRTYLPVSGGGVSLLAAALYKITHSQGTMN